VVEKLVFRDEQGNVISESGSVSIGNLVKVRLVDPPEQSDRG